jgi:hypothetical protein
MWLSSTLTQKVIGSVFKQEKTVISQILSRLLDAVIISYDSKQFFFFNWYCGGWSPIGSTRHCGHQLPIVSAPDDYDDGEIGGMMIGRGNRSTRRKPDPVQLCPPQTPHAARTRTQAAAVGSQHLTAELRHGLSKQFTCRSTTYNSPQPFS